MKTVDATDALGTRLIQIYTQPTQGQQWLQRYQGQRPHFVCVLGFTATALIPGISAAGATPADRQWTAIADAEFLVNGAQSTPHHPLPPPRRWGFSGGNFTGGNCRSAPPLLAI
ncbi:hypothetical protein [Neosynechococcus sphagnicola]|uniref:hypothetical protein n=1 Tax=Neosynechococcus sphagnicola TaxID=1501145 RepID=UPI001EF9CDD8|nr:hypothetical protein [Neosynechococcus sphagnicola]